MAEKLIVAAAGILLILAVNWYFLLSGRRNRRQPRT
jgi:hypothetical protein